MKQLVRSAILVFAVIEAIKIYGRYKDEELKHIIETRDKVED